MTNRHRFYRYLASGGVSTAAHYLTLYALVQMGTEPVLGSTIAALVGLVRVLPLRVTRAQTAPPEPVATPETVASAEAA